MTEYEIQRQINDIMDQVANHDTHLASVECADDLATLALAEWLFIQQGEVDIIGKLFKIALALGYEARRRHESYTPLDTTVWNNAFDDNFDWDWE